MMIKTFPSFPANTSEGLFVRNIAFQKPLTAVYYHSTLDHPNHRVTSNFLRDGLRSCGTMLMVPDMDLAIRCDTISIL